MSCIVCTRPVTTRQHAPQCDGCSEWQHRLCGTGISLQDYRDMCRGEDIIAWYCLNCSVPVPRNLSSNRMAGFGPLGFYRLVPLLQREAELATLRVDSGNLHRDVRRSSTYVERRLEAAWDSYETRDITTSHFLKTCDVLYQPE